MKYDVSFVTCVYDDLHDTTLAGRHNRGTHYAFSLAQMHQMGVPIYCFTDKINLYKFFPCILKHGHENFNFISYNLDGSPYYEDIQRIKETKPEVYVESPAWKQRCVEIMWGKFDWIIHVAEKIGLAEDKYLFWIDAGLSHPGVIPKKYNSVHDGRNYKSNSHEYAYRFYNDRIFNKDFPDFLVDYIDRQKLLHFLCTQPQHNDPSPLRVAKKHYQGTTVGGLFGGTTKKLHSWAQEAKRVCNFLIEHDCLIKEEDVLTHLINQKFCEDEKFDEQLRLYRFKTWYHEDWEGLFHPSRGDTSFSDFFEEFIEYRGEK